MNAFSSSLKTLLFSLIFAMLLVLTAGQTASSIEDQEQFNEEQQKNIITPDDYMTPEIIEQSNNFWPPMHLRGLRSSSNGKPTFIRFGKRASPSFIRFGRK